MTAFFKGRAVSQVDKLLINGKEYTEKQIKDLIKRFEHEIIPAEKKKR